MGKIPASPIAVYNHAPDLGVLRHCHLPYYRDHPPPHFHAIYGEYEAKIDIATGGVVEGELPRRARGLVKEWARARRQELERNWELARAAEPLVDVAPLE